MGALAIAPDRRRILVVDDVELNRTLTTAVLRGATYEVDSVDDGVSALAAVEGKHYDLVLMDLEMPGIGGHEAATRIRQRGRGGVKLAALSSRGGSCDRTRSLEAGMSAHITRPIAPRALLAEIERVFCQPPAPVEPSADPWDRRRYDEWVERLGAKRMHGFLVKLSDELRGLLVLALEADEPPEALHRLAHDVASTAGMLGFLEVTRCCRAVLENHAPSRAGDRLRSALAEALEAAIHSLDHHLASAAAAEAAA